MEVDRTSCDPVSAFNFREWEELGARRTTRWHEQDAYKCSFCGPQVNGPKVPMVLIGGLPRFFPKCFMPGASVKSRSAVPDNSWKTPATTPRAIFPAVTPRRCAVASGPRTSANRLLIARKFTRGKSSDN